MPYGIGKIRVDPQGQSLVVDITNAPGTRQTVYTTQAASSAHSLPVTITEPTEFWVTERGTYVVSAKLNGREIAGRAGNTVSGEVMDGGVLTVNPVIDNPYEQALQSGTIRTVRKTADEIVSNSTTLQDDDHLLFPIEANAVVRFRFVLFVFGGAAGAASDFFAALTVPASATFIAGMVGPGTAATSATATNGANRSLNTSGSGKGVGTLDADTVCVTIEGIVTASTTAGNVTLQWSQNAAGVTDTTVKAGSYLQYERLA